jgi:opacity protein-like surface antigen
MKKFLVIFQLVVLISCNCGVESTEIETAEQIARSDRPAVPGEINPKINVFSENSVDNEKKSAEKTADEPVLDKNISDVHTARGDSTVGKFQELSLPYNYIGGTYCGIGVGLSRISCDVSAVQTQNNIAIPALKESANQFFVSAFAGFGTNVYKQLYLGIELELSKTFSEHSKHNDDMAVKFISPFGINMNIRVGYQFPQYGLLLFMTAGFCRITERTTVVTPGVNTDDGNYKWITFGSFYPTIGVGAEYKFKNNWSARLDFKFAITSKDDSSKNVGVNGQFYSFVGKPSGMTVRFSVVRSIY